MKIDNEIYKRKESLMKKQMFSALIICIFLGLTVFSQERHGEMKIMVGVITPMEYDYSDIPSSISLKVYDNEFDGYEYFLIQDNEMGKELMKRLNARVKATVRYGTSKNGDNLIWVEKYTLVK
jgi:hypothetical protein